MGAHAWKRNPIDLIIEQNEHRCAWELRCLLELPSWALFSLESAAAANNPYHVHRRRGSRKRILMWKECECVCVCVCGLRMPLTPPSCLGDCWGVGISVWSSLQVHVVFPSLVLCCHIEQWSSCCWDGIVSHQPCRKCIQWKNSNNDDDSNRLEQEW